MLRRFRRTLDLGVSYSLLLSSVLWMSIPAQAGAENSQPALPSPADEDWMQSEFWQRIDGKPVETSWEFTGSEIRLNQPSGGSASLLSKPLPTHFALSWRYKISERTNSGLKYRVRRFGKQCPGVAGEVRLTYFPTRKPAAAKVTRWHSTRAEDDFTCQWNLKELQPGSHYAAVIEARPLGAEMLSAVIRGQFRTAPQPAAAEPLRFCMTTCHDYLRRDDGLRGHKIYPAMSKLNDASFKLIISPTPIVGPDRNNKRDNHANESFAYEGRELRQEITKHSGVIVLCGDRHWQYASRDSRS